jgi:hypothetical protein
LAGELAEFSISPVHSHSQHVLADEFLIHVGAITRKTAVFDPHDVRFKATSHEITATIGAPDMEFKGTAESIRINGRRPIWWSNIDFH